MSGMTISQALRRAKKLKGIIAESLERAAVNVVSDLRVKPAFEFAKCMEEADKARAELVDLETSVSVANARTHVSFDGEDVLLTKAVKLLQELKGQIAWLKTLSVKAQSETTVDETENTWTGEDYKTVKVERKFRCELPEAAKADLQRTIQDKFDRLNDAVESANHRTLLENSR
jgi:hypothetical protein